MSVHKTTVWSITALLFGGLGAMVYAKTQLDEKRKDPVIRASRLGSLPTPDVKGADPDPGRTPLDTTTPGVKASVHMNSQPTGVDTSGGSVSSQQDR